MWLQENVIRAEYRNISCGVTTVSSLMRNLKRVNENQMITKIKNEEFSAKMLG